MIENGQDGLLVAALDAAVPLWQLELRATPLDGLLAEARDLGRFIGEKGDIILFKSRKPGESAEAFNKLAKGIAILSFMPGGVRIFGRHWQAVHPDSDKEDKS